MVLCSVGVALLCGLGDKKKKKCEPWRGLPGRPFSRCSATVEPSAATLRPPSSGIRDSAVKRQPYRTPWRGVRVPAFPLARPGAHTVRTLRGSIAGNQFHFAQCLVTPRRPPAGHGVPSYPLCLGELLRRRGATRHVPSHWVQRGHGVRARHRGAALRRAVRRPDKHEARTADLGVE